MERLTRTEQKMQKKTTRTIILLLFFLIIVVIMFFMYGMQIIINFSLFLEKTKNGNNNMTNSAADTSYIAPPVINPMPDATNSAQIIISGYSLPDYAVKLYVNDQLAKSEKISNDKTFSFKNVTLKEGQNQIKTIAVNQDGKESNFSEVMQVSYITKAPSLTIDSPSDGQEFSGSDNQIKVIGTTDPNVKITINDFWAIVDDNGKFSYLLPLQKGDNHLKIIATDQAGNRTTKELKVTLKD